MQDNFNIIEFGKNTRFGASNGIHPKVARRMGNAPWSVRNAIRRIAAMDVKDFKKLAKSNENMTFAYAVAIVKFQKAMSGDLNAMQQIEDTVDGKLSKKRQKRSNFYFNNS